MNKQHIHWFTLIIEHQYFKNNECTIFDLLPVYETQRILKNYGIRFQKYQNKYHAYAEVDSSKKIGEELKNTEDLYFQLINSDPNFNNYTDITSQKKEQSVSYITNSEIINRLNKETSVAPKTYLEVRSLRFNLSIPEKKITTIIIKTDNQEIYNQKFSEEQSNIPVDITAFGIGVYELWINGVLSNKFIGLSNTLSTNCYGILHIKMRNILESLKENTIPLLKIFFNARSTFREYVIIVPEDKKIEIKNIEIEASEDEQYKKPKKELYLGNQKANVFTSTNAIKFSQLPKKHAVLKIEYNNQFSDALLELEMKLPVPAISSIIKKEKNNENVYYSQSVIYV
ncbi:hypothetical protein [Tenacibaculum salmonis]|uniref:hypothetical protein n=1 Tax=Tenacibaculum sp. P3-BQ1 TaxID=3232310 RepID=UPI0034E01D8D